MLNLSIVIHNNNPQKLIDIINFLTNKITNQYTCQLVIITEQKHTSKENKHTSDIVNDQCQGKNIEFKIINLKDNEFISSKLLEVITGDTVIFTSSRYIPDENWLDNIIQSFSYSSKNILMGNIIDVESEQKQNLINSSSINKTPKYIQIGLKQIENLAIRKEFLKRIKHFNFLNANYSDYRICCRILRELENEIQYLPDAIVRGSIVDS